MLFNSYVFIFLFFPAIMALWWARRIGPRARLTLLTIASYVFYGYWDYRFVAVMLTSTVIDFISGERIDRSASRGARRLWLAVSLAGNLGLLGFFKYAGLFAESVNTVFRWAHVGGTVPVLDIVLPVGISFYTFQSMSYTIDIYRGHVRPTGSFWRFAAYVSMFPQLVAGPIVRYADLEPQLQDIPSRIDWDLFWRGMTLFVLGMAKKILIADVIASRIDPPLSDYMALRFFGSWFCTLGYTAQLYFDFSGYSDMAVGLGSMLGFSFPQNFNSPYKAANVSDFWRRWHISLSSWLRDYLYVGLGGGRKGRMTTLRNLLVVMFLGGLWHGAAWTYVAWGLYHGVLLVVYHLFRAWGRAKMPIALARALTFICVVFGWAIFRSNSFAMFGHLALALSGLRGLEAAVLPAVGGVTGCCLVAGALAGCMVLPNTWQFNVSPRARNAVLLAGVFLVCVTRLVRESPFLYFQF